MLISTCVAALIVIIHIANNLEIVNMAFKVKRFNHYVTDEYVNIWIHFFKKKNMLSKEQSNTGLKI